MANTITQNTFSTTYKDDYADSDNYHRILFNAGRALQARELTQMQTIAHNELRRFGSNIFKEGGAVRAGNITLDTRVEFIKLDTSLNPLPTNPQDLVGLVLTVQAPNPGIKVQVIEVVEAAGGDPATLYVKYTDTSEGTSSDTAIRVPNGALLGNDTLSNDLKAASASATGAGTKISIDNGDYFVQGHFVFVDRQSIFVSKYTSTPTATIGFKIVEDVVTTADDTALFDNQGAVPNTAAPGADRYRIRLTLTNKDDVAADENFVYITQIVNGRIVDESSQDQAYNTINDLIALRTKEESGDYVVSPFIAKFNELDDSNLQLEVTSGVAYVDGYRLSIPQNKITVPKARDTITLSDQNVIAQYGNFVLGSGSDNKGLPNINTFDQIDLMNDSQYAGASIGTARVRAIEEDDGTNYKFYMFDIQMDAGQSFASVRSFGNDSTDYVNVALEGGNATLRNTSDNSLLFDLPSTRPSSSGVTVNSLTAQRRYEFTGVDPTTTVNVTSSGNGDGTFTNTGDWIISELDSAVSATSASFTLAGSPTGSQVQITGLTNGVTYELIAYAAVTNPTATTKTTPQTASITKLWPDSADSDGNGLKYLDLGVPDIYQVTSITLDSANGSSVASNFTVDNGQRDNFYALGRVIAKGGASIPSTNIHVAFKHFEIASQGDFFSVNSYASAISYDSIPDYRKNNGETINLRNVLDFRTYQNTSGNYTAADVHDIPQVTDIIGCEVEYYMPRKDRLIAAVENSADGRVGNGSLRIIQGVSSLEPQLPETPVASIPLYDLTLNAYTLDEEDVETSIYSNKRFTMKDIAQLESRIDDLVELTTLSLLETNTSTFEVYDSTGIARTKAGFLADAFSNYAFSEIEREEYRASVDASENVLRPTIYPNSVRLLFDSDTSTVVRKGDFALLSIDSDEVMIDQNLCTETINVNPFEVIVSAGHVELSPSTDTWVETRYVPPRVVSGGTTTRSVGSTTTNNSLNTWQSSWLGRPTGEFGSVSVITGSRVVRQVVGDRILNIEVIPWMRSINVNFRAQGLRPNTLHWPFFGGINIGDFARQSSGNAFTRFSATREDAGNTLSNQSAHPDIASSLVTDSAGTVTGSFVIPSTPTLRFRTGGQEFKLLDISVDNEENATSTGLATFISSGTLETRQRTIRSTRVIDTLSISRLRPPPPPPPVFEQRNERDPLAQSFRIDQFENPAGVFITKVDVFFQTKSTTGVPARLEIRAVENGVPVETAIPGAVTFLSPSEINVPSDFGRNENSITDVRLTPTTFEFDEPIFLDPGREYALVLMAETIEYNVYVAQTYDFVLGSTEARVAKQPTLGSFFTSQNATTWTPDQTRDLMFKIYRAEFATSGSAVLNNSPVAKYLLEEDPFEMDSGSATVRVYSGGHGMVKNNKVLIEGLSPSTRYAGVLGSSLLGTRTVANVDHTGFTFTADSDATATIRTGGSDIIISQNILYNYYFPTISNILPRDVSLASKVKLTGGATSDIGSLSYANDRNLSPSYVKASTFSDITINELNETNEPKIILSDSNETTFLSGNNSFTMQLDFSTLDTKVSPIIDLQRISMTTFENVIDKQDSAATDGFNVPLSFVAETHPTSGSSAAKHITTVVTLEEPAVGLKILLAANRPSSADFVVYYKVGTTDEVLDDKNWVLIQKESILPADNDGTTFREYEYLAGGIGGNLTEFTQYQVKIVMTTTNSSEIPIIRDLRAIALVT